MSQFIDSVKEKITGKRSPIYEPLCVDITTKDDPAKFFRIKNEYEIEVSWRRRISCETKDIRPVIDNVVRELREAVYGDLKQQVLRLERAVYEQDREAILSETRDIVREIFG